MSDMISTTRILFVDDENNILSALSRQLYNKFDVTTAQGGLEGLKIFQELGPFSIVVSDLKMPGMDGVSFLGKIHQVNPDVVRILLTGQADLNSAISAVNEGHIFRFLTKPCMTEDLISSLKAAETQYNLITSERVLLEQTLQGSIKTLSDILSIASPDLFSMVNRVKSILNNFLTLLNIQEKWPIEVSAMLSQIGTITLPDETIQKLRQGTPLDPEEKLMVARLPEISEKLLSHIPRLELVRKILLYQDKHYDGSGTPQNNVSGEAIPIGSRILKILLDYDRLKMKGYEASDIFDTMFSRNGWYDDALLKKFTTLFSMEKKDNDQHEISIYALQPGMILVDNLYTKKSTLLVRKGVVITPTLLERILNIEQQAGIKEPIKVSIPKYFDWIIDKSKH
jgi:response regulator RpfG family c-di-GMP phosphodiesterase